MAQAKIDTDALFKIIALKKEGQTVHRSIIIAKQGNSETVEQAK